MKLDTIKNLLQISCNFNTSAISHSFMIGKEDTLMVRCLKNTFVLEITSSENKQVEYYTSIDQAAEIIFEKINANETN